MKISLNRKQAQRIIEAIAADKLEMEEELDNAILDNLQHELRTQSAREVVQEVWEEEKTTLDEAEQRFIIELALLMQKHSLTLQIKVPYTKVVDYETTNIIALAQIDGLSSGKEGE
jgi:hypothetical protein